MDDTSISLNTFSIKLELEDIDWFANHRSSSAVSELSKTNKFGINLTIITLSAEEWVGLSTTLGINQH